MFLVPLLPQPLSKLVKRTSTIQKFRNGRLTLHQLTSRKVVTASILLLKFVGGEAQPLFGIGIASQH